MMAFPGNQLYDLDIVSEFVKHDRSIECGHAQAVYSAPFIFVIAKRDKIQTKRFV